MVDALCRSDSPELHKRRWHPGVNDYDLLQSLLGYNSLGIGSDAHFSSLPPRASVRAVGVGCLGCLRDACSYRDIPWLPLIVLTSVRMTILLKPPDYLLVE